MIIINLCHSLKLINMIAVLLAIVWLLCFVIALDKIENLGLDSFWIAAMFFFIAPFLHLIVLIGWGITGYTKKDWENLL